MRKLPVPGDAVQFVDAKGTVHNGLITACWAGTKQNPETQKWDIPITTVEEYQAQPGYAGRMPCVNLVIVDDDVNKTDSYGRQVAPRITSCSHKSMQNAHGYYWKWPEEELNPYTAPLT